MSKNTPEELYKMRGMTPPDQLHEILDAVADEPPEPSVDDYASVIVRLHDERGMSFRAITEFLSQHGVKTNRTTVHDLYREAIEDGKKPDDEEDLP